MLIDLSFLNRKYKLNITGVLHIGAHECEEYHIYIQNGINPDNIIWIEGNQDIYNKISKIYKNVYQALISDKKETVTFRITNNGASSSILELDEHKREHPHVLEIKTTEQTTTTIVDLFKDQNITIPFNFVNIDIQGAELLALKGMGADILNHVDYIYLEVNVKYLYKNCALLHEIDEYLSPFGFQRVELQMTGHGWGDAFYIRQSKTN